MIDSVGVGSRLIGHGQPIFIIAEIGINHNGDIETAKKLIDVAVEAGCDAVKFQKRTPAICVPPEQAGVLRETPWGTMTYLEYKERIEFGHDEYAAIDKHCQLKNILWFASPWDIPSVMFLEEFNVPLHKVASACLTDDDLLLALRATNKPLIMSTGMSTLTEIDHAVSLLDRSRLILGQATSTYPCAPEELNLRAIESLRDRYRVPVGYSGHETGLPTTVASAALGAVFIERHITLNRAMWGTDHSASVEPHGLATLVRHVRTVESALGDGIKTRYVSEESVLLKLRRVP
ncbi:MAG: N-acetylneuraminate synthase [Betaproteobacteria bacterium]|nr:N-acetylneuraminate synthase [Betaproteobacteria bacterium]